MHPIAFRTLCVSSLLFAVAAEGQGPQTSPTPVWEADLASGFKRMSLSPLGGLLVETKGGGVFAWNPETGAALWSRPDGSEYVVLEGTANAILKTASGLEVVDLGTGNTRWRFAALPIPVVKGYLNLTATGLILLYGPTTESTATVLAVHADSGTIQWRQDRPFHDYTPKPEKVLLGRHALPVLLSDTTILVDADEAGLIALHLRDGHPLWNIPDRVINLDDLSAPIQSIDGTLLISYKKKLASFDAATGTLRWSRSDNLPAAVNAIQATEQGLLVSGHWLGGMSGKKPLAFADLLDPATGSSKWAAPVRVDGGAPFLARGDSVFTAGDRSYQLLDLVTAKTLMDIPLTDFGGGEEAAQIESLENGDLLLSSDQNLMRVGTDGHLIYHRYLKAPGMGLLGKILVVAAAAASATATGYYNTGPVNAALLGRFNATTEANRFAYIFTNQTDGGEGGFFLARVDKTDGRETGRIRMPDRSPDYILDPVSATIVVAKDQHLVAYRY